MADVIMGVAASSMVVFDRENMLQPYAPQNLKEINAKFRDAGQSAEMGRHGRVGARPSATTWAEMQKQGLPRIELEGSAQPEFKGKVVMPTRIRRVPAFDVVPGCRCSAKGGWEYMDKLHDNVAVYSPLGLQALRDGGAGSFSRHLLRSTAPTRCVRRAP